MNSNDAKLAQLVNQLILGSSPLSNLPDYIYAIEHSNFSALKIFVWLIQHELTGNRVNYLIEVAFKKDLDKFCRSIEILINSKETNLAPNPAYEMLQLMAKSDYKEKPKKDTLQLLQDLMDVL